MIFLQRRRLLLWLLRAYIKKWKKTILVFFGIGLIAFFLLYIILKIFQPDPFKQKVSVGIIGSYTVNNLPSEVSEKLSYGLTGVAQNARPYPMAASSWTIKDNGKTYIFNIKDDIVFNDRKKLTSGDVNYNFEDVLVERPSKNTIVFKLKDSYSPFLITVSRPIFRKGFVGLGEYKIKRINTSGDFVDSITLSSTKSSRTLTYQFYPTEESLKLALLLGEINKTNDVSNLTVLEENLSKFKNLRIKRQINYNKLVTLFYNTQGKALSDKRLRQSLAFAIPNTFAQGQRVHTPYPPSVWASQEQSSDLNQDIDHAKLLLKQSSASASSQLIFNLKTLPKYKNVALEIRKAWQPLGIKLDIETVNTVPSSFDIFLGEFFVSKDPDQYALWHSSQTTNITGYRNLRIDKLLEDGRQITDTSDRRKIYADFQKYLLDDPPASFLFFPFNYSITK